MSHPFKNYEVEALRALLAPELSSQRLYEVLDRSGNNQVEYTNYGFYVTVDEASIGSTRRVYSQPALIARFNGREAGFVAFLENNQLTLETHPWDGEGLPPDYRDGDVQIVGALPHGE
jgi:hypothetical protein